MTAGDQTNRYRVNPGDRAASFEERLRGIERRIDDLSAARSLRRATMSGGLVRWLDDAGQEVVGIGSAGFAGYAGVKSGRGGLRVVSDAGGLMFLATAEDGVVWPPVQAPFGRLNDAIPFSSGTFTEFWQSYLVLSAATINTVTTFVAPPGSTGEARLVVGGTGLATAARPIAAGTQTDIEFSWDLTGLGVGLGTALFLNVQARLVSGAGPLNTYLPRPARMSDRVVFGGTANGIPYVDDAS